MTPGNVSHDLVWQCIRNNSSFIVKRKDAGQVVFSREPLNLLNKHSFKHSGLSNAKAIGVVAAPSGKGISLITKNSFGKTGQKPCKTLNKITFKQHKSSRKVALAIVNSTTRKRYRPDLRKAAVARTCAILLSQKEKKAAKVKTVRGKKAQQ
ncbi:putative 60S ribosomal protein L28e [Neolecta irregularis DAH-3]|uniref:Putative 60S ribosomal protein L28e n=1 Tax=Neolecta irregularis (strain DAH-3) TaxID=1198029 RepID=A0A1U7LWK0_NEOID|nr:putative 60S ribosomal protein L28e [Neolecta irregularis DAH-3]|eukprot:OLL27014.1 putative 60S ribosomal protein L28e [Neolecta irregularis DAH-3]